MSDMIRALQAELMKNRHSGMVWATFIAFALAPAMGGLFMLMAKNPEAMAQSGALRAKANAMNFQADIASYLGILTQAVGVGGILLFGFVAGRLFGREYTDDTAKDLMALPISRTRILNAKFVVYALWCVALVTANLLLGLLISLLLHLPSGNLSMTMFGDYYITALLTLLCGTPVAFFALKGKGYLTPLGVVALTLVLAQVIAAAGYGNYFPWSIPGLFAGTGGRMRSGLTVTSYGILAVLALAGYVSCFLYWNNADHSK